ncbi:RBBP9/YdeN family alpha/beta hydrolase [Corynebacterium pyruviciproducens]|uniref:Alpha/beta hydrolase n=1 Tax=Corynebacterium pyruviciproducens TaxID=598660 RepID=A0AAF1BWW7_9CORY|nr:alpha/beta hydrolase [Corynebacterium pyruviciproducens]WOT02316.1 alpha/beta hydrolase [Corynebacterium pyruviciproducens]
MSIETFLLHPPVTQVFIIHGLHSSSHKKWFQWLSIEGLMKGIKFKAIELPDPDHPDPEAWREKIALEIGVVTKQIGIVGHSLGCSAALQYLDSLTNSDWKLGRMVLVAGFNEKFGKDPLIDNFVGEGVDLANIKEHVGGITVIRSDDDPSVPAELTDKLAIGLGVPPTVVPGQKHFADSDGVNKVPEVLEGLVK